MHEYWPHVDSQSTFRCVVFSGWLWWRTLQGDDLAEAGLSRACFSDVSIWLMGSGGGRGGICDVCCLMSPGLLHVQTGDAWLSYTAVSSGLVVHLSCLSLSSLVNHSWAHRLTFVCRWRGGGDGCVFFSSRVVAVDFHHWLSVRFWSSSSMCGRALYLKMKSYKRQSTIFLIFFF